MKIFHGIKAVFQGAWIIINDRNMKILAIIPFLLNIALLSLVFWFGFSSLSTLTDEWLANWQYSETAWFSYLLGFIQTLLGGLIIFILFMVYLTTAAIISAPFNELLSQKCEQKLGYRHQDSNFSMQLLWQDMIRIGKQELKKIWYISLIATLSLFLNMIPLLGQILYAVVNTISLSFFTGLEYLDFAMERQRLTIQQKMAFAKRNFSLTVGLGLVVVFFMYIPLIFSFATVGATKIYLETAPKDETL